MTPGIGSHRRGRPGLGVRLVAAQLVVVLAGALTIGVVAVLVAPGIFTRHLDMAHETDPMVRQHAQEAFDSAFGFALGVATLVSIATATLVSAFVVHRLTAPVTQLAFAADALAGGDYSARVPAAQLGPEFDRLTAAFTGMAARLARTEISRRQLMADLAHEMRTPVNTLQAHVEALEDGVVPAAPQTWQVMRDQLDRLTRLAADMGQLSALEEHAPSVQRRPGDLTAIASAAVEAADPRYRIKGVQLELVAGSAVEASVDPVRVQQVLANLLDNALRHTPSGRSVTVTVSRRQDASIVTVTDTGTGIPPDELAAVFDRFHRVDGARARAGGEGSGLGLTIARAIITGHGGTLTAASAGLGTGSSFTISLPVVARVPPGHPPGR
jgi:two-component system, OmpR family, sensor histidine kinase BaeS